MSTWVRGAQTPVAYAPFTKLITRVTSGNTILRSHFGIKADGFVTASGAGGQNFIRDALANYTAFGLVTTIGDTTETVPSPIHNPGDAVPPAQRWLYLASSTMSLLDLSGSSSTYPVGWSDPFMDVSTKGQVLAPSMPPASTLNLWLVGDTPNGPWEGTAPTDIAWYSMWWSVLLQA